SGARAQEPDGLQLSQLLSAPGERPSTGYAAEKDDELPSRRRINGPANSHRRPRTKEELQQPTTPERNPPSLAVTRDSTSVPGPKSCLASIGRIAGKSLRPNRFC